VRPTSEGPSSCQRVALLGLLTALSSGLFVLVALNVDHTAGPARHDQQWLHDVVSWRAGWLTGLFKLATHFGSGLVTYGLLVAAALLLWKQRRDPLLAIACVAWLGLGQLVRLAVNTSIARPRPPTPLHLVAAAGYAFPSGHTTNATIAFGLLAFIATRSVPRHRWLCVGIAVFLSGAVGLSRVYLGVHWPTDVLGGWILGIAWLCLGAATGSGVLQLTRRRPRSSR
jgi:membrane-associated phospholipid phosphatase